MENTKTHELTDADLNAIVGGTDSDCCEGGWLAAGALLPTVDAE